MRRIAKAGTAAVAMVLALAGAAWADCPRSAGQHAILASDGMNPDVFVWDTHEKLVNYLSGHWSSTRDVMTHAILVSAGTPAAILACRPRDARTQYDPDALDVYVIRVLAGPHRSHQGWVVSSDAHLAHASAH